MKKAMQLFTLALVSATALPLEAQQLDSVQLHAGMVNLDALVSGETPFPLVEPVVDTDPPFDGEIKSYSARVPYGVEGVTLVVETSMMIEPNIIDYNGVGGELRVVTYRSRTNVALGRGTIMSFPLQPGDNRLRLSASTMGSRAIYEFAITRPDAPSADTTLAGLRLGRGELDQAFHPETKTYRTRLFGDSLTVIPTPGAGAVATLAGTAADGSSLNVDGDQVFGLTVGENAITIDVQAENGTTERYTLTVDVTPSNDAILTALQLGSGELDPAFARDTRTYRTRLIDDSLTVTPTPGPWSSVTLAGIAADGSALNVDGNQVAGFTGGANTIAVVVGAQDGTNELYLLVVDASDDVRAVAEGDTVSWQDNCDVDTGCDGTLNGVEGRFACKGEDWSSDSPDFRISFSGFCRMAMDESVVTNVTGWIFAAFSVSE